MRRQCLLLVVIVTLFILQSSPSVLAKSDPKAPTSAAGSTPKVGDPAPAFSLPSATGSTVALKDYAGKSNVVLIFYRGYW
ncbi:MAG: redoxin domain-containing protein [Acidobacteria bacterium]|nr:redoxin domain-containing protein [Acidobacteriota bacterium]